MSKSGNGNGGSIPLAEGRKFTRKDMVELCVLSAYIVQQKGLASLEDVTKCIKDELNSSVNKLTLKKSLESLRFKDILAINYEGGIPHYKMKKIKFNCNVEIAHVTRLLTALLDDAAGVAIKVQIENELGTKSSDDSKGKGYPKGPMAMYTVKFKLNQVWLGPYPLEGSPVRMEMYQNSRVKPSMESQGEPFHVFERTPDGEKISIHVACVRGFFRNHLNMLDRGPGQIYYFHFKPIEHAPVQPLSIESLPVQRGDATRAGESAGAGFVYYEALKPGEVIEIKFLAPTVNFITPDEMKVWLTCCFEFYGRSMSPARGTQTGGAELVDFSHELMFFTEKQRNDYDKKVTSDTIADEAMA